MKPGLGTQLRHLLELLDGAVEEAYALAGMRYRPRYTPVMRALIAQENRRYARRQLIWFRKEPNLSWFDGPGESAAAIAAVTRLVDTYVARP